MRSLMRLHSAGLFARLILASSRSNDGTTITRRLQDTKDASRLPTGIYIKNDFNVSLPIDLTIVPTWDLFLGFSDAQKLVRGRLSLITVYPKDALRFVSSPELVVDIDNFGSGEKHMMGNILIWDDNTQSEQVSASKVYVGEFSQALREYQMSCYPFDKKTIYFNIGLQKPADMIFSLRVACVGEGTWTTDEHGRQTGCRWPAVGSFVGFDWQELVCESKANAMVECRMEGLRQSDSILTAYLWPSVIYSLMGFIAFGLNVKLTMPRVATTMLALVSLTSLRNQVLTLVPSSGDISWIEEYFLIAVTFMSLNLVGHTSSFYLDYVGKLDMQKLVNKINLWGMLSIFCLIVTARLHARQCDGVDAGLTALFVALSAIWVILGFFFLCWYYRASFHELFQKVKDGPSVEFSPA